MCGALTIQRHRDTVRQLRGRRTRKEHKAFAPWERQRFANCPLWQPHDNGDILRSPPTQNVQPCTYLHHASFNIHAGSTRRDGNRSCRVPIAAVSQKHKRILTSYSPRHTLLSDLSRGWLSMSTHQNRDTPPRHGVLSGKNSEARVADMEVFVVNGTESESKLPESLARCHGKRCEFVFPKKIVQFRPRAMRMSNCSCGKRQRNELCLQRCPKEFHPVCQTLKKQHHSDHCLQTRR